MSKKVKEYSKTRKYDWSIFKIVLVFPIGFLFVMGFGSGLITQDINIITTITLMSLGMVLIAFLFTIFFGYNDVYKEIKR